MSPAPLAQPNALTTQATQVPGPMRRPSLSLSPPPPPSSGATVATAAGPDVTPTSPSPAASGPLVSIRPLPSPSLYPPAALLASAQASVPPARPQKGEPSVVSMSSTSQAYAPPYAPPSASAAPSIPPPSSASSVSSMGEASSSSAPEPEPKENTGRWLAEEHEVFLKGLDLHGKQWKKIALMIQTRSVVQVRTHAQKYFQKLLKGDKKEDGAGNQRASSIISASTAVSTASSPTEGASASAKRKSSSSAKGGKATTNKKRRVSLEPKPKKHHQPMVSYQYHPASLPSPAPYNASAVDHAVIDPSFMHTLNMAEGELDDSLLDLLDDSSIDAVEKVIGSDDDLEPNPVTPSISSQSLVVSSPRNTMTRTVSVGVDSAFLENRQDMVTSPNPTEDFSIHNKIGTAAATELSPTSVTCTMDIKDFEQKTGNYTDAALDWLMDDGWRQLPASDGEEDWSSTYPSTATAPKAAVLLAPPLSANENKVAQISTSTLPAVEKDVM